MHTLRLPTPTHITRPLHHNASSSEASRLDGLLSPQGQASGDAKRALAPFGARQAGQMRTIQTVMAKTSLFCMSLNQLRALILAAGTVPIWPSSTRPSTPCWSLSLPFLACCEPRTLTTLCSSISPSMKRQCRSSTPAPRTYGLPTSMVSRH